MWHITPFIGTTFYIYVSRALKSHFQNSSNQRHVSQDTLQYFYITHFVVVIMYSFYTFVSLCRIIAEQGIQPGHRVYMSQPYIKTLIFWVYLSKYYEYFDTFLLNVKGREPFFVQKYHHAGAVICWHLCYKYDVDMIVFGTILNSGVHLLTFGYYFMTLFKINIKVIEMCVLVAQLAHLVCLATVGFYFYYPPVETAWNYGIIVFANLYMVGVFYLLCDYVAIIYFSKSLYPCKFKTPNLRVVVSELGDTACAFIMRNGVKPVKTFN